MSDRRIGRALLGLLVTFLIVFALLPPLLAGLVYQTGQAMFVPFYEALYTYFLPYTILLCAGVTVVVVGIRILIRRFRRPRTESSSLDSR